MTNTLPTIEMIGCETGKPAFAGSPQSAQADFLFSIAPDFNRGTNTGVPENYVWNADGTLANFPGPDYGGGNVQLAYEYAYGFDGGRRWRKDYLNNVWTRYPCGVACGAGDLVEQQKPLEGGSWTTTALYLQGISLVRRNGEWHHFDPLGTAGVITNSSASVISNNLYDVFGVLRYQQGSAETTVITRVRRQGDEQMQRAGAATWLPSTGLMLLAGGSVPGVGDGRQKQCEKWLEGCIEAADRQLELCIRNIDDAAKACVPSCFLTGPFLQECLAGCALMWFVGRFMCRLVYQMQLRTCYEGYAKCLRGEPFKPPWFYPVPLPPYTQPPALQ